MGWKIDYRKLLKYLKNKYSVSKAYYFGGVETYNFNHDYASDSVSPEKLKLHLSREIKVRGKKLSGTELALVNRYLQRVKFYLKLEKFGYKLVLKPVKLYSQDDGTKRRKANCDVDMAFYMMREKDVLSRAIILSGDGDFLPVLRYLKKEGKEVIILSRGPRTAREIRQFAGDNFRDFEYLKYLIKQK